MLLKLFPWDTLILHHPTEPSLAFLSSGTRSDWNFLLGQSLGSSLLAISARWKFATWADARCTLPLAVLSGLASFWAFRASSSSVFMGIWIKGREDREDQLDGVQIFRTQQGNRVGINLISVDVTHRCMLWFQVVLQTSLRFVRFPTVGAIQQHLLKLRLLLSTLLHVVHIAHDAGEGSVTALWEKTKTLHQSFIKAWSLLNVSYLISYIKWMCFVILPLWSILICPVSSGFCAVCLWWHDHQGPWHRLLKARNKQRQLNSTKRVFI